MTIALQNWAATIAPDDARFRLGAVRAWAEAGSKTHQLAAIEVAYELGGLPSCEISIPFGVALPLETAATVDPQADFTPYQEVKVYVELIEPVGTDDRAKPAFTPGKYLVFWGEVKSVSNNFSGSTMSALSVVLIHRLAKIAALSSIFGRFQVFHEKDIRAPITHSTERKPLSGTPINPENPKTWEVVLEVADRFISDTAANTAAAIQTRVAETGSPMVQRIYERLAGLSGPNIELLKSGFTSLLTNRVAPDGSRRDMYARLAVMIVELMMGSQTDASLLKQLVELGSQLGFGIVGTASRAHVIPDWPFWTSDKIKVLPAGSALTQNQTEQWGDVIAVGALIQAFPAPPVQTVGTRPEIFVGGYLIPTEIDFGGHGVLRVATLPGYLSVGIGVVTDVQGPSPTISKDRVASASKPRAPDTSTAEKLDALPRDTENNELVQRFARLVTFSQRFQRAVTVICGLRQDIVPGMNLRVDNAFTNGGEQTTTAIVGRVVACRLSIDAVSMQAVTSVQLDSVRSLADQVDIIDQPDDTGVTNGHFLWQDVEDEINKLTLWDPA